MRKGWVKIHRRILDTEVLQDDVPFNKFAAWVYIIINASPVDKVDSLGNEEVRGQWNTSELFLAKKFRWDRKKVHRFLKELESAGMIKIDGTKNGTRNGTIIFLVKYEFFQHQGTINGTINGTHLKKNKEGGENLEDFALQEEEDFDDVEWI